MSAVSTRSMFFLPLSVSSENSSCSANLIMMVHFPNSSVDILQTTIWFIWKDVLNFTGIDK